jgi:hypothetical protein
VKEQKQKKQVILLSALVVVLTVVLYYAFVGTTDSTVEKLSDSKSSQVGTGVEIRDLAISRNPHRTAGKKDVFLKDIDPTIHLEKLSQFEPGTPLNSRNMFSLEAQAVPVMPNQSARHQGAPKPISTANGGSSPGSGVGPRSAVASSFNINLKFIGFALNPIQKTRQGFFADGEDVYLAAEGQLVANRYRVVRIGDASAEIEEVTSKTRRQISLVTQ